MELYDIAVIGGGPAGYLGAQRACDAGLKTLLVEKQHLGGVCLNEGCIPTKTLLYAGKTLEALSHSREISCVSPHLDHSAALAKKAGVVKTLVGGVTAASQRKGVQIVRGSALVSGKQGAFAVTVGEQAFSAKNILIATGSTAVLPPIAGLDSGIRDGTILTSTELLNIPEIPKSLVIVGGGVIGVEMAEYFNAAGSKVSVVEMADHIGGEIDREASSVLQRLLEKKGIAFRLNSRVSAFEKQTVTFECDGKKQTLPYDKALICVGRKPCCQGTQALALHMNRGAIATDARCATNLPGVYAAGDVNGKYMLAHVAYREAEVAVNNILGRTDHIDYAAVPGAIYTNPEVAFVGMTDAQAKAAGYDVEIRKASANMSGRHLAEQGASDGFCKLVTDQKKGIILGATLVCAYASELIYPLTLMVQNQIPLESVKRTIFPHPTVCEVIREAIFCD